INAEPRMIVFEGQFTDQLMNKASVRYSNEFAQHIAPCQVISQTRLECENPKGFQVGTINIEFTFNGGMDFVLIDKKMTVYNVTVNSITPTEFNVDQSTIFQLFGTNLFKDR